MNIFGFNPDLSSAERTALMSTSAATNTTTVLNIKNSKNFTNSRRVLIGVPTRERSEMCTQSANTPTTLTVGTTNFNHDPDDPVYALDVDQIRFRRSTNGVNGNYSVLATIDIDWNNPTGRTIYDDTVALPTYFYTVSYYDSIAGIESDLSVPIQATGYPDNSVGTAVLKVAQDIHDNDFMEVSIPEWIGFMNDISKDLYKRAKRPYRFLKRNISLDIANANDDSIPFPTEIWKINYTEVNQTYSAGNPLTFRPKLVDVTTMRFRQSRMLLPSDYVNEIAYDDEAKVLMFNPRARTTRLMAFNFHIYKMFDKLTDMSSLLETPDDLIYQLGMKRAYYMRKMDDDIKYQNQFQVFDKMYSNEIAMMQREKTIEADGPAGMKNDRKRYLQFGPARYRR